jgi:multidrug transporter EmrE-like cation transporter
MLRNTGRPPDRPDEAFGRDTGMALRIGIVLIWAVFFSILNLSAKKLAGAVPLGCEGLGSMMKYCLTTRLLYVLVPLYGACAGACAALNLAALHVMPLSVAGPLLTAIGMLISFLLGIFFFGELLSSVKVAGIALCGIGVWLLFVQGN